MTAVSRLRKFNSVATSRGRTGQFLVSWLQEGFWKLGGGRLSAESSSCLLPVQGSHVPHSRLPRAASHCPTPN
jgi:hypothetical protein